VQQRVDLRRADGTAIVKPVEDRIARTGDTYPRPDFVIPKDLALEMQAAQRAARKNRREKRDRQ